MPDESGPDFENFVLKETSESVEIATSEANRRAAIAMVRQATHTVDIISRDLDARIYDDREFLEALRQLVVKNSRARVRVLIQDVTPLVSRGHRLLELTRRLSSHIEIRIPNKEHAHYNFACMVVDAAGTIHRTLADRYDGIANFNNPGEAQDLTRFFNEVWETSETDPNLRRLGI